MGTINRIFNKRNAKRVLALFLSFAMVASLGVFDGIALSAATNDLLDGTGIDLIETNLLATWPDGNGGTDYAKLAINDETKFPYNSDISLELRFSIPKENNQIEVGKEYNYTVPAGIRVDVDATHIMYDPDGVTSIGQVHISKDGTLTFTFNDRVLNSSTAIPFFVKFDGGLSSELQKDGQSANIKFPTSTGTIDYPIKTEPKASGKKQQMSKSGSVVTIDGQKYIAWKVEVDTDDSGVVDGEIIDNLPAGLTYVVAGDYPKLIGAEGDNTGTFIDNTSADGKSVSFVLDNVKSYYRAGVEFLTSYDAPNEVISNGTKIEYDNTASFNPEEGVGTNSNGTVTITPNILKKSNGTIDDNGDIEWTITLNEDNFNLNGAVLEDILGEGLEYVQGSFSSDPALTNEINNGVKVSFTEDNYDSYVITYRTHVTDLTKSNFVNNVTLKDTPDPENPDLHNKFNLSAKGTTPGIKMISKSLTKFNALSNTHTWKVTVNEENRPITSLTVNDWFPSDRMEFVSATLDDGQTLTPVTSSTTHNNVDCTKITFDLTTLTPSIDLSKKHEITVVTKVKDEFVVAHKNDQNGVGFNNYTDCVSNYGTANAEAADWRKLTKPQIITKNAYGFDKNTGYYTWTIDVYEQPEKFKGEVLLTDTLPQGMEFVEGSMEFWYWTNPNAWTHYPLTPSVNNSELKYTFNEANANEAHVFDAKGMTISYKTKISDFKETNDGNEYTNNAKLEVTYDVDGGIPGEDTSSATAKGQPGGVVGKTGAYHPSDNFVTWTVDINKAHYDMSSISNPKITDQLADYFKYTEGTLYKINDSVNSWDPGYRTPVAVSDYTVAVVNNRLTIVLPQINSDYYQFVFKTQFTCTAAELSGKKITNTANFEGLGEQFQETSNEIQNVSFSSSSAGALINREIRIKKVDSSDKTKVLSGAEFDLYYGNILIGSATSGADGYAVFRGIDTLIGYELKLRETTAPSGYLVPTEDVTIPAFTSDSMKTDGDVRYYEVEVTNESANKSTLGDINIVKQNAGGENLSGAEFGLYKDSACTDLVEKKTSDETGRISFKNKAVGTYFIKEIEAPEGYKLSSIVTPVELKLDGTVVKAFYNNEADSTDLYTITNDVAKGTFTITKVDSKAATLKLSGAEFEIYDDSVCSNRIGTATTSDDTEHLGEAVFSDLELGKTYYYREVKAPTGYVLDNTIHEITIGTGKEHEDQNDSVTVKNDKELANIIVKKVDDSATPVPLKGVKFTLYNSDNTVFKRDNNDYVVETNSEGIAMFSDLPFGDYVVKETQGLPGYKIINEDTNVTLNTLGNKNITVINEVIKADVVITKTDDNTVSPLVLKDAEFNLLDEHGTLITKGKTDELGKLTFSDIPYGKYIIRETKAPDGYVIKTKDTVVEKSDFNLLPGQISIEKNIENHKMNGSIVLLKKDNVQNPLADAKFTLYDSNKLAIETKTTDANGEIKFENLKYGTYYIQETEAPVDYILDTTMYTVSVSGDEPTTNYTENGTQKPLLFTNNKVLKPIVSLKLKKVDDKGNIVPNAKFGLFRNDEQTPIAEAISDASGLVVFRRVNLSDDPNDPTSGVNPDNVFTIKEISAPTGYKINNEVYTLGKYAEIEGFKGGIYLDGDVTPKTDIAWYMDSENDATVEDEAILGSIVITKQSSTDNSVLKGAKFELLDSNKNSFATPIYAITDEKGIAKFENLPIGYYYVKEIIAPTGYSINSTNVEVSILNDTPVKKTIKDTPIELKLSKKATGGTANIPGAEFELRDKVTEELLYTATTRDYVIAIPNNVLTAGKTYTLTETKAPAGYGYSQPVEFTISSDGKLNIVSGAEKDGQTIVVRDDAINLTINKVDNSTPTANKVVNAVLAIYDSQNNEVDRFTTGTNSYSVPVGKLIAPVTGYNEYTLKEIVTPSDYETASPVFFRVYPDGKIKDLHGDDMPSITMVDELKTNENFYLRKVDDVTGQDISGAVFYIYEEGNDTDYIHVWNTDGGVHKINIDGTKFKKDGTTKYRLVEFRAPSGYTYANTITFIIKPDGKISIVSGGNSSNLNGSKDTLIVRDKTYEIKLRKENLDYGNLVSDAKLGIYKYFDTTSNYSLSDQVTYVYTDGSIANIDVSVLQADTKYVIHEDKVPDGYNIADDFIFIISKNGQVVDKDGNIVKNNIIVMTDEEQGITINKFDSETNLPMSGVKLELSSTEDTTFQTITRDTNGTKDGIKVPMNNLKLGVTYTLKEIKSPNGYGYSEPIEFKLDYNTHEVIIKGEPTGSKTIVMKDNRIDLSVSKLDSVTEEPVSGAGLLIVDASGNEVVRFDSGKTPVKLDYRKFVAPPVNGYNEYILKEIKVPTGYEKADDVVFAIDHVGNIYNVKTDEKGDKQYIIIPDGVVKMMDTPVKATPTPKPSPSPSPTPSPSPKPSPSPSPKPTVSPTPTATPTAPAKTGGSNTVTTNTTVTVIPKTGDETPLGLLYVLFGMGVVGFTTTSVIYYKRRRKDER